MRPERRSKTPGGADSLVGCRTLRFAAPGGLRLRWRFYQNHRRRQGGVFDETFLKFLGNDQVEFQEGSEE